MDVEHILSFPKSFCWETNGQLNELIKQAEGCIDQLQENSVGYYYYWMLYTLKEMQARASLPSAQPSDVVCEHPRYARVALDSGEEECVICKQVNPRKPLTKDDVAIEELANIINRFRNHYMSDYNTPRNLAKYIIEQCPAALTTQQAQSVQKLLQRFKQHIEAIPLGQENCGNGQSDYNWGVHYLRILEKLDAPFTASKK